MIGVDVYAHTILGVDIRKGLGNIEEMEDDISLTDPTKEAPVMFLILDPHYKGNDTNLKNIIQKRELLMM